MVEWLIPPLRVTEHDGILILRDDLVLGGTKARVIGGLMTEWIEWVYAGPVQGYAQVALAIGSQVSGAPAVVFVAKRNVPHPLTAAAARLGARVVEVPAGRLSVLEARARAYCEQTGAAMLPLGLRLPGLDAALGAVAAQLDPPAEAWVAVGSGSLAAALAEAWPATAVHGVIVGAHPRVRHARVQYHQAPERFEDGPRGPMPPVPSVDSYDAKAWRFVAQMAAPGALWWNVGGPAPSAGEIDAALAMGSLDLAAIRARLGARVAPGGGPS